MLKKSLVILIFSTISIIASAEESQSEQENPQQSDIQSAENPIPEKSESAENANETKNVKENKSTKAKSKHFHPRDGK